MTMEWHAEQMKAAFAAKQYALARWHCRIFSRLARERAANLFNDGNGGARPADSLPVGTPSPIHARDAQDMARKGITE